MGVGGVTFNFLLIWFSRQQLTSKLGVLYMVNLDVIIVKASGLRNSYMNFYPDWTKKAEL